MPLVTPGGNRLPRASTRLQPTSPASTTGSWAERTTIAVDRAAGKALNAAMREINAPTGHEAARDNRALIWRMVRYLAREAGIRQFLDLGSGLPTQLNVHEVAQRFAPEARVLYVDYDPVVKVHADAILAGGAGVEVIQADLRDPAQVLSHPNTQAFLDLGEPVAVLFMAMLHSLYDEEKPNAVVTQFRDALAPGSQPSVTLCR